MPDLGLLCISHHAHTVLKFWHMHYQVVYLNTGDKYTVRWVLPSLLGTLNISASDRKQDNSMCLQGLKDVREEDHLIERIQPQVSH